MKKRSMKYNMVMIILCLLIIIIAWAIDTHFIL